MEEKEEMNRWRTWDFKDSEIILDDTVIVDVCQYAFVKAHGM